MLGIDVGRLKCTTEVVVFKVTPQTNGPAIKTVVNIYTYEAEHFEEQAIKIKKLFIRYKARAVIIDANGLGVGLIDYMVKDQVDPKTRELIPNFGVINDKDNEYKKFRTVDTLLDVMYLIKADAAINTKIYNTIKVQTYAGKVRFLIDERFAKTKLLSTKMGQSMDIQKRNEFLKPFTLTSVLREQMLNLKEENEGINIILKQSNRNVKKDKFSAFGYGLYYIVEILEKSGKKKKRNIGDFLMMN